MITLAFDTATARGSVALVSGNVVLGERTFARNEEGLFVAIEQLLRAADLTVAQVELFAVGLGPGSFTGVRAGIAAATGLALPGGQPVHGVCTLDVIAQTARAGPLRVICDARREEVYWADYDDQGRRMGTIGIGRLAALPAGPARLVSSEPARHPMATIVYPSASVLVKLAQAGPTEWPLKPIYLRQPEYRTIGVP